MAPEPSPNARRARPADVRGALLEAAVAIFYERGYRGTSVSDVVQAAGCTKGAFYHYFPTKESLLEEISDEFLTYALARADEIAADDDDVRVVLTRLIEELLRQVELYRPHMTIVFQEYRYFLHEASAAIRGKFAAYEQVMSSVLERGIRERRFRTDLSSTRALAFGILNMCVMAHQWFAPDGPLSSRDVGAMYASVILDGLALD